MSFSIADLFRVALLLLNAMAILSERRLLEPMGLSGNSFGPTLDLDGRPVPNAKDQLGQVLKSVRMLLRWPLIILNIATVVFSLIFG